MALRQSAMFSLNGSMRKSQQEQHHHYEQSNNNNSSRTKAHSTILTNTFTINNTITATAREYYTKASKASGHYKQHQHQQQPKHNNQHKTHHSPRAYHCLQTEESRRRSPSVQDMTVFDEHREIEQVLDCVKKDGCRYYKIRWKDTWEREDYLAPFLRNITQFWEDVELSRKLEKQQQQQQQQQQQKLAEDDLNNNNNRNYDLLKTPDYTALPDSSAIHDRPPSPVYRNGGEYSPPVSDLSDRCSPYSTTSSTTNLKSPAAASDVSAAEGDNHSHSATKKRFDFDDVPRAVTSPSAEELSMAQSISSGRRKGRPKKHVREDQQNCGGDDEDEEIEIDADVTECVAGGGEFRTDKSISPFPPSLSSPTKTSNSSSSTSEQQHQHLTVEIPENHRITSSPSSNSKSLPPSPRSCASTASFPTPPLAGEKKRNGIGSVEEYPVMIIRDSEDSRMQKTQIHKPDALRFTSTSPKEPARKRSRISTPPGGSYSPPHSLPITVPSTVSELLSRSEKYITSPASSAEKGAAALHPHAVPSRDATMLYARSFYPGAPYHHQHHNHLDYQVLKSIRERYYEAPPNHPASAVYHARSSAAGKRSPDLHYLYAAADVPRNSHRVLSAELPLSQPMTTSLTKIHHHSNNKFEASQLLLKVTEPLRSQETAMLQHSVSENNPLHSSAAGYPIPPPPLSQMKAVRGRASKESTTKSNNNNSKTPTKYLITADGEQRPQCPECFQTFKKRAALERHMMIHRGIKPFQCHFCNQRFRQKHHLQGHIMLHTGERPHACTLCNKRFRMRHHLLEHERISHKVFR